MNAHILMTDLIYDYGSIPHRANRNPNSLNVQWGGGHASISTTRGRLTRRSGPQARIPGESESSFLRILVQLRP
jgi:hypothetical protein